MTRPEKTDQTLLRTVTGLMKFDNHSENYRSWRSMFSSVLQDLSIPSLEEVDLLISWLGPQSLGGDK